MTAVDERIGTGLIVAEVVTGEVVPAASVVDELVRLDRRVDVAEGEGILARWEFGRGLLARRVGKQLPHGLLDEVVEATGKNRRELQYRVKFAETFTTEAEVCTAVHTFGCWAELRESLYETTAERLVASNENEWYTPDKYLTAARKVLGGIDLDPATSELANQVVKATRFYTQADDGLSREWSGRVWLNPPYGRLAGDFIERLVAEHLGENITSAIALVNAHCTDTAWFQALWHYPLCFTDHRIDFESAGREKKNSSTHGSVFAYLGPDNRTFKKHFSTFGAVVVRA